MKVSAQTPVVLAALTVAGSLASNVEHADKRQLTGLPFVVSGSDQLTTEQKDALATLTKGLNGAATPLSNVPANPLPGLPVGVGASNLPNVPQIGNMDANSVAMLIQQNQQILSMLSAYLPPQAAAALPNNYGSMAGQLPNYGAMTGQLPTGQLMSQFNSDSHSRYAGPQSEEDPKFSNGHTWAQANNMIQGQLASTMPLAAGSLPKGIDPSQLLQNQPWAQANNMVQGQLASTMPLSSDSLPKGIDPSQLQNQAWSQAGRLANSVGGGQLMQNLPVSQTGNFVDGIANGQLGQNVPFSQAAGVVNGIAGGQFGQNLPLSQATGLVNGVAGGQLGQNLPFSQASGVVNGVAGGQLGQLGQLGQNLPFSQASGVINGVAGGQLGQNLPLSQAGGIVNGVTNGQLGQGLPFSQAGGLVNGIAGGQNPLAQAGGIVNGVEQLPKGLPLPLPGVGGGGGGLLGGLLGPLNLQQHDHKGKHHDDDAVRTGTDLLATATAYMAGGPTGALGVPFKAGHQLNENVTISSSSISMSDAPATTTSSASRTSASATTTWSAPSLVRTSSYPSTIVPPATSTAVAYSAPSSSATWSSGTSSSSLAKPSATTSLPAAEPTQSGKNDDEDNNGDDNLKIRPQRRAWTWVAPRGGAEGGRFLPREAPASTGHELVAAKASLEPIVTNLLANGPKPTSSRGSKDPSGSGSGRARMAMKKGKKTQETAAYDDAKDALIKAEASLWEAEHPEGLAIDINDTADKKGVKKSKNNSNSALWAWIGSGSNNGDEQLQQQQQDDDAAAATKKEMKSKKGKKKGSSTTTTTTESSIETGPSYTYPATWTKATPAISVSVTVSAPIRPTLKASLFGP
ncbi:unnamed protein product [Tilletia laevis]|uniref:Uncharacterized protein n=3 Tax=Tilletia TaxID=13289 RepID=A0A177U1S6_9BASI|nr:hypothetical protein CF336_g7312 [Tilletia laevis]KAE8249057.1 hypothetical protein A4X03_0g6671 [Tilletia caries]CAD6905049.1 unnamed protein product [Tilletia controversa]KAE8189112.1 hypothetical protein CF335_g6708 [Tilletia laevis]CAD6886043.1 unnamed protein product [Tilletia caries]